MRNAAEKAEFALRHGARQYRVQVEATRRGLRLAPAWAFLVLAIVGCHAPANYYVPSRFMMRLGDEMRAKNGSAVGETLVPPAVQPPIVVPITVDANEPVGLMSPSDHAAAVGSDEVGTAPRARTSEVVRIDVDRKALSDFLRTKHAVGVVDTKAINGRFTNGENLLRVEFIPRGREDAQVYRDFLLVCAVIVGMDRSGTVDAVVGLATDQQLIPWLSLKASLGTFDAYQAGEISFEDWQKQVETHRL